MLIMSLRTILIIVVVIFGLAFLLPSNPYTDVLTRPVLKTVKKVGSFFDEELDVSIPAKETKVYKWQDEEGNWHFSNTEPPKNVGSESKVYKDDVNVVPAPKTDN